MRYVVPSLADSRVLERGHCEYEYINSYHQWAKVFNNSNIRGERVHSDSIRLRRVPDQAVLCGDFGMEVMMSSARGRNAP
jgi:hypothetical protein